MAGHASAGRTSAARRAASLVFVALLAGVVYVVARPGPASAPRLDLIRDWAPDEDVAAWHAEWARRAPQHLAIVDPPGEGPVAAARYWLSRGSYEVEVRRRGERFVLVTKGVDEQTLGGGWAAIGEGRIRGGRPDAPFAGAVATFSWSCLGVRYRYASGGAARLAFGSDGRTLRATYMALEDGDLWLEADGVLAEGPAPARGTLEGQVLAPPTLARLEPGASYGIVVEVVRRDGGPVAEALVQVMGLDATRALTNDAGRALLHVPGDAFPIAPILCAGHPSFRNGDVVLFADDPAVGWRPGALAAGIARIELDPRAAGDDPSYTFVAPHPDHDPDDVMACGTCHMAAYQEWLGSRHARMDDHGHVRHERGRLLAAGGDTSSCDACHRPGHALQPSPTPRGLLDANHCDLCHKIAAVGDVREDGVLGAYVLARPDRAASGRPGAIHGVFGPRPDVTYAWMGATWNPLFGTSHLCGGCHQGAGAWREGGLPKVDTFAEWSRWAVAVGPDEARSCQDCHMPAATTRDKDEVLVRQLAWDSLHRTPDQVHAHTFLGVAPALAQEALDVRVASARATADRQRVEVRVENVGAGHLVPTGTWTKHIVLGVWARQGERWCRQVLGPRAHLVPDEEAAPARAAGDWRNPAGTVFGIRAQGDGDAPFQPLDLRGAWRTGQVDDTRLAPGAARTLVVEFAVEGDAPVEVEVRLVHRRGALGAGPADVAWPVGPYDPPPEMLLLRQVVR